MQKGKAKNSTRKRAQTKKLVKAARLKSLSFISKRYKNVNFENNQI